jgi:hypothetical protein
MSQPAVRSRARRSRACASSAAQSCSATPTAGYSKDFRASPNRRRAKSIASRRSSSGRAPSSAQPTASSYAASRASSSSSSKAQSSSASTARPAQRANASSRRRRRQSSRRCSPATPSPSTPEATRISSFSAGTVTRSISTPAASGLPVATGDPSLSHPRFADHALVEIEGAAAGVELRRVAAHAEAVELAAAESGMPDPRQ